MAAWCKVVPEFGPCQYSAMGRSLINWVNLGHHAKTNFPSKAQKLCLYIVRNEHFLELLVLHQTISPSFSIPNDLSKDWLSSASRDINTQDVQGILFLLLNCPSGDVIRSQPAVKWQHAKQISFLQPFQGSRKQNRALTGHCVAQQGACPLPLSRSKEDNNSDKSVPSRGCSQHHQGRKLDGGLQCVVHIPLSFEAS